MRRHEIRYIWLALALALLLIPTTAGARTLVHAGAVIDGVSDSVLTEMTIVVEDVERRR